MTRKGIVIQNSVRLEPHEYATISFLAALGKHIELIPPSHTPNTHNADFFMDGLTWEMKSPIAMSKPIMERTLDRALKQSCNIVIDLRRAKGQEYIAVKHLQKCFKSSRRAKRLLIISKDQEIIDLKK